MHQYWIFLHYARSDKVNPKKKGCSVKQNNKKLSHCVAMQEIRVAFISFACLCRQFKYKAACSKRPPPGNAQASETFVFRFPFPFLSPFLRAKKLVKCPSTINTLQVMKNAFVSGFIKVLSLKTCSKYTTNRVLCFAFFKNRSFKILKTPHAGTRHDLSTRPIPVEITARVQRPLPLWVGTDI